MSAQPEQPYSTLRLATVKAALRRANLPLSTSTQSKQNRVAFSTTEGYTVRQHGLDVTVVWTEKNFIRPQTQEGWDVVLATRKQELERAKAVLEATGTIAVTFSDNQQQLICSAALRPASEQ